MKECRKEHYGRRKVNGEDGKGVEGRGRDKKREKTGNGQRGKGAL